MDLKIGNKIKIKETGEIIVIEGIDVAITGVTKSFYKGIDKDGKEIRVKEDNCTEEK